MTLLQSYNDLTLDKWSYYAELTQKNKDNVLANLSSEECQKFVTQYFQCGQKGKVFDFSFIENYLKNGKHIHTASLCFLGCTLYDIIDKNLKHHLLTLIPNFQELYDFKYTWFLTCLYHDVASSVETINWRKGCSSDLDFYLGKHDVKYNFFEHNGFGLFLKPYTYSENLVKDYFKYRVEYCHAIDHGIIAGYLIFDKLVKNYYEKYEMYINSTNNEITNTVNKFEYEGLSFRQEHLSHFAIIADAIVSHNIWKSDNKNNQLYKDYGLDALISTSPKLTAKNNPLAFFLGLLDTIEPLKFFCHNGTSPDPINVLQEIEVTRYNSNNNSIGILIDTGLPDANKWIEKIKASEKWLDVKFNCDCIQKHKKEIILTVLT